MQFDEHAVDVERFPLPLRGRILRSVHFRAGVALNQLCDVLFERYANRFFEQEHLHVYIEGECFFGYVARVFPPRQLSDLAVSRAVAAGHHPDAQLPPNAWCNSTAYGAVAHVYGTDLDLPADEAISLDRPSDYRYLMHMVATPGGVPIAHPAGGSSRPATGLLEVTGAQLARHPLTYSKAMIQSFLQASCEPLGSISEPWQVKDPLCSFYGLARSITPEMEVRNRHRSSGLAMTRNASATSAKRGRPADLGINGDAAPKLKRVARQPIDDLDISSHANGDSRGKPGLDMDLGVNAADCELLLSVWSFLNNFGELISLGPFTLDDFISALQHDDTETPCPLIAEVHATMLNTIIAEGTRMPGAASVSSMGFLPLPMVERDDGMTEEERVRFMRRGMVHARKWDRSARLKSSKGRKGWQRYLIGALCQRGALETLPSLPRIVKHLFDGDDGTAEEGSDEDDETQSAQATDDADDADDATSEASLDEGLPSIHYGTLPLGDKVAMLSFLCNLCSTSHKIRHYIETTELFLTELRKHRTQLNKTKRELEARKHALEQKERQSKQSIAHLLVPQKANGSRSVSPSASSVADDRSGTSGDRSQSEQPQSGPSHERMNGFPTQAQELVAAAKAEVQNKQGTAAKVANVKSPKKGKGSPKKAERPPDTREGLEAEIAENNEQQDELDRNLRRCREVIRNEPLGRDRFLNSYIWLDGIGCQQLTASNGSHQYGTGRLFVRAPDIDEVELLAAPRGGIKALRERQRTEEGAESTLLEPGQWAIITSEEQLDQLLDWLNDKGSREGKLKEALIKWRPYLLGGMKKRARDVKDPTVKVAPALGERRSARLARDDSPEPVSVSTLPSFVPRYLTWKNSLAVN